MIPRRVRVEPWETDYAALVGAARARAVRDRAAQTRLPGTPSLTADITGALGELAVAKALGTYWAPSVRDRDKRRGDVDGLQVRATWRRDGRLVIRPDDADDQPFVLVVGEPPDLSIVGWIYPRDARAHSEWRAAPNGGPPATMVPGAALFDWDERPL